MVGKMLLVHEREVCLYRVGKYMNETQCSLYVPLFCCVKIVFERKQAIAHLKILMKISLPKDSSSMLSN